MCIRDRSTGSCVRPMPGDRSAYEFASPQSVNRDYGRDMQDRTMASFATDAPGIHSGHSVSPTFPSPSPPPAPHLPINELIHSPDVMSRSATLAAVAHRRYDKFGMLHPIVATAEIEEHQVRSPMVSSPAALSGEAWWNEVPPPPPPVDRRLCFPVDHVGLTGSRVLDARIPQYSEHARRALQTGAKAAWRAAEDEAWSMGSTAVANGPPGPWVDKGELTEKQGREGWWTDRTVSNRTETPKGCRSARRAASIGARHALNTRPPTQQSDAGLVLTNNPRSAEYDPRFRAPLETKGFPTTVGQVNGVEKWCHQQRLAREKRADKQARSSDTRSIKVYGQGGSCLLYTSPSPRDS
eukprot:TRINITY_DN11425_c0_g1_i1.p1 TRINITY_DN11425_c0_g1~~TRINITY_DN11425_c0_g1_i1.p1  ORF type:complete len:353 (+),score=58.80 TRINITY_DN11425_c0_g1_i1:199-1257(+)